MNMPKVGSVCFSGCSLALRNRRTTHCGGGRFEFPTGRFQPDQVSARDLGDFQAYFTEHFPEISHSHALPRTNGVYLAAINLRSVSLEL